MSTAVRFPLSRVAAPGPDALDLALAGTPQGSSLTEGWFDSALGAQLANIEAARLGPVLEKLAAVFYALSPRLSDVPLDLFDQLFLSLMPRADLPARASLSSSLAPISNAPPGISRHLARDEAPIVAAPMLRLSSRLDLPTLLEIAQSRSQEHLVALAQRAHIDPELSSLIVMRGQGHVLRTLVRNVTAHIPDDVFATITARASAQKDLQDALKARADLPAEDRARLEALQAPPPTWRDRSAAHDADLLAAINQSDWLRTSEILAGYTRVSASAILATFSLQQIEPTLACARAAAMDWDTTQMLLIRRLGAGATSKRLQEAHQTFKAMSQEAAVRALRFLALKARMMSGVAAG